MTDARRLFDSYVRQRTELGTGWIVLPEAQPLDRSGKPLESEPPAPTEPRTNVPPNQSMVPEGGPGWRKSAPAIPTGGIIIPAPSEDLFTRDPLREADLAGVAAMVRVCDRCQLCQGRIQAVPGEGPGDARLMVVGEGPGATEDQTGRPFVGRAGELLTDILAAIDTPREKVFICNIVKCRPPSNRKPNPEEISACVPYLYRQIALVQPSVILAMGGTAAETLLNTKQSLGQMRSRVHQFRGIPLVVTYHPAALLRNPHWKKPTWDDVRIARRLLDGER